MGGGVVASGPNMADEAVVASRPREQKKGTVARTDIELLANFDRNKYLSRFIHRHASHFFLFTIIT